MGKVAGSGITVRRKNSFGRCSRPCSGRRSASCILPRTFPPKAFFAELRSGRSSPVWSSCSMPLELHYLCHRERVTAGVAFYTPPTARPSDVPNFLTSVLGKKARGSCESGPFAPLAELDTAGHTGTDQPLSTNAAATYSSAHRLHWGPKARQNTSRRGGAQVRSAHPVSFRVQAGGQRDGCWTARSSHLEELRDAVASLDRGNACSQPRAEEGIDPAEMLQEVTRDDRFVADGRGFLRFAPLAGPFLRSVG